MWTKDEKKTLADFLKLVQKVEKKCNKQCDDCPIYDLCGLQLESVEEFKKELDYILE